MRVETAPFAPWEQALTPAALRRAWLAVRANRGGSGADGETIAAFERRLDRNLDGLRRELLDGSYRPRRVSQVLVPKPSPGWRPLTLWAVRDRVAQRAVYDYLEPALERRFLDCSYGFRPGRTTADAARAVAAARAAGADWVLDADIKDCFGSMQPRRVAALLRRWQVPGEVRRLVDAWLGARVWNAWRRRDETAGVGQGSAISPLLCNLYLHEFDQALSRRRGTWLVRYADDFVILCRGERRARRAQREASRALQRVDLQIHPQKTRLTRFADGFQFVGWFFIRDEHYQLR